MHAQLHAITNPFVNIENYLNLYLEKSNMYI